MTKKCLPATAVLLILVLLTTACVNLKQVNDYASKSLTGIKKFEDIDYGFKQFCNDRCSFDLVRKAEVMREISCDCSLYKSADSVTMIIYSAVRGYFDGLMAISDNGLTTYKLDGLSKALVAGDFGDLKIGKEEVDAYRDLSKLLLKALTDEYRNKKIKEYVTEANQPVQVLLQKLQLILQTNLEGELEFKKESGYAYYKEMSLSKNISDYEKDRLVQDYYQQLSETGQQQKKIDVYAKGLKTIAAGHQKLFENLDKMTAKEISALISQYSSDIEDIISEFNKLKK